MNVYGKPTLVEQRCCQDEVAIKFQEACQCCFRKSVTQRCIVFFAFHRCLNSEL